MEVADLLIREGSGIDAHASEGIATVVPRAALAYVIIAALELGIV